MTIFKLTARTDEFQFAVPVDDSGWKGFDNFGKPLGDGWIPVEVELVSALEDGRSLRPCDLVWLVHDAPAFTRTAIHALAPLLSRHGELLPLSCRDSELFVLNVLTIVDALDMEQSSVQRFESTGRVWKLDRPVFRTGVLRNVSIFKIPQMHKSPVFVTDEFRNLSESARLEGFDFSPVWPN